MDTKVMLIFAGLLFSIASNCVAQITTKGEALDFLKSNVLLGMDTSNIEIYSKNAKVSPNDTIILIDSFVVAPQYESWLFFIDECPYANWGHRCRYVFIGSDCKKDSVVIRNMPPINFSNFEIHKGVLVPFQYSEDSIFSILPSEIPLKNVTISNNDYAVIISGGANPLINWPRYWNDCSAVYKTLINKYHYLKDNIYVIMANGTNSDNCYNWGTQEIPQYRSMPYDLDGDGTDDIQYAATVTDINSVFNELNHIVTGNDNVFIFVTDHGGEGSTIFLWENAVPATWFASQINKVSNAKSINICMEQCYSGGYTTVLEGNNRVIATACAADEVSWPRDGNHYDEFCYNWIAAVNGMEPNGTVVNADNNNDGYVSMSEAFAYAKSHDYYYNYYPSGDTHHETPQFSAPEIPNLGPYLTLSGVLNHEDDLMIRDSINDNGAIPSNVRYMWNSPDIWLEDMYGNPITNPHGNTECRVCVKITNNGDMPTYGGERLFLNWAKAGCDLRWDYSWTGNNYFVCGARTGNVIGDPEGVVLPIIDAHSSYVKKVTWSVPRAEDYAECTQFDADKWHFCIVARVHDDYPIAGEHQSNGEMGGFTINNNNVAWKNISILDAQYNTAVISFSNPFDHLQNFRLHFKTKPNKSGDLILEHADIIISLDDDLVDIWKQGGRVCIGGKYLGENRFLVREPDFYLDNIVMPIGRHYTVETGVRFFTQTTPLCNEFEFDIIEEGEKEIIGGEHYFAVKDSTKRFKAIALENKTVLAGDSTTFTAQAITEDAQYTWFNTSGDTLAIGNLLQTSQNTTQQYILEVVSDEDSYKDVDTVTVTVRRAAISALTPNPANNQTVVSYRLASDVTSASIVIASTTGQVQYSAPLDVTQTTHIVNLQAIPTGQYSVRIESQGSPLDAKTLIVY